MAYFTLGYRLPRFLRTPLFGDRERFGRVIREDDPCWLEWQRVCVEFYEATQKRSVGGAVNDAGYRVLRKVDLDGAAVLEIGPGRIGHAGAWRGRPDRYVLADVRQPMLDESEAVLRRLGVPCETRRLDRGPRVRLPFDDASFDVVVAFYVLEHLDPLDDHLAEIRRVLRPGGVLVGAIPAEGGVAWGLGRFLTTRRWARKHTSMDYDKIICWEHPNFADAILRRLDEGMHRRHASFWPLRVPLVDVNLIASFVHEKRRDLPE